MKLFIYHLFFNVQKYGLPNDGPARPAASHGPRAASGRASQATWSVLVSTGYGYYFTYFDVIFNISRPVEW